MKRTLYILLMMIFSMLISFFLYFSIIFSLVYYHIVSRYNVLWFTDMTLSGIAFGVVICIGAFFGYHLGKKWWKIIYVDKVYYFGKKISKSKSI